MLYLYILQTMVFPTRLIFGRLMPVISATFSPSTSHTKSLYDALVVWRPLESHIRYGAVNYVLHFNETTLEYRVCLESFHEYEYIK